MADTALTLEELEELAELLSLDLSSAQLAQLLPEIQRLRDHAARLRALPLGPEEPPLRFATS